MSNDEHAPPPAPDEAVDAGINELLAGPSPINRVHGAIELDASARGMTRPSQLSIEAGRSDILAALWGLDL